MNPDNPICVCGLQLYSHNYLFCEDKLEECDNLRVNNANGEHISCILNHDGEHEEGASNIPWVCPTCMKWYMQCKHCKTFCYLDGHAGYRYEINKQCYVCRKPCQLHEHEHNQWNESRWHRTKDGHTKQICTHHHQLDNNSETILNSTEIVYDCSDLKIQYLDGNEWFVTGPDGGEDHYWWCPKCDLHFSETDK